MNKEILALEKEIAEGLSLIDRIDSTVNRARTKIEELKKESEVKPVFPVGDDCAYYVSVTGPNQALKLGLSARNKTAQTYIIKWLEARAYVIEAINKANCGDNGFKIGEENNIINFNHETGELRRTDFSKFQIHENLLYIRSVDAALELLKNGVFVYAYKIMLGITQ